MSPRVFQAIAIALCLMVQDGQAAGFLSKLRGGGGDGGCADGSCGRPIGIGLKKPGSEVGYVEGDRAIVKMYAQGPQQPQQPIESIQEPPQGVNPLLYFLAASPMALCIPLALCAIVFISVRKMQESDSDD